MPISLNLTRKSRHPKSLQLAESPFDPKPEVHTCDDPNNPDKTFKRVNKNIIEIHNEAQISTAIKNSIQNVFSETFEKSEKIEMSVL